MGKIGRRHLIAAVALLAVGLSVAWAAYWETTVVTPPTPAEIAKVEPQSVAWPTLYRGVTGQLDDVLLFKITAVHAGVDDKLAVTVSILNPADLRGSFRFLQARVYLYSSDEPAPGPYYWDVEEDWGFVSLSKPEVTLYTETDLSAYGYPAELRVVADVHYRAYRTATSAVSPVFYCEVDVAGEV